MARSSAQGFSHLSLPVSDLDRSIAFYEHFASLKLLDRSTGPMGFEVARLSDSNEAFVLALAQVPNQFAFRLNGRAHLGVECESRQAVSSLAEEAKSQGVLHRGPREGSDTVGFWAFLLDPDGHQLEISYGESVGIAPS